MEWSRVGWAPSEIGVSMLMLGWEEGKEEREGDTLKKWRWKRRMKSTERRFLEVVESVGNENSKLISKVTRRNALVGLSRGSQKGEGDEVS